MAYPSGVQIGFHTIIAARSQAISISAKLASVSKYDFGQLVVHWAALIVRYKVPKAHPRYVQMHLQVVSSFHFSLFLVETVRRTVALDSILRQRHSGKPVILRHI